MADTEFQAGFILKFVKLAINDSLRKSRFIKSFVFNFRVISLLLFWLRKAFRLLTRVKKLKADDDFPEVATAFQIFQSLSNFAQSEGFINHRF
jgi:hypothetical protein